MPQNIMQIGSFRTVRKNKYLCMPAEFKFLSTILLCCCLGLTKCKATSLDNSILTQNGEIPPASSILNNPECSGAYIQACYVNLDANPEGNYSGLF